MQNLTLSLVQSPLRNNSIRYSVSDKLANYSFKGGKQAAKNGDDDDDDLMVGTNNQPLADEGSLFLNGYVNHSSIMPVVMSIMLLNDAPNHLRPDFIKLFLNTPGGSLSAAFQLIDVMESSPIPVVTIATGMVASAGTLILMTGHKGHRAATKNATIMSHQLSSGGGGTEGDLRAQMVFINIASKQIMNHYAKCTKRSENYIRKNMISSNDVFMTPEEAIKHGFIDIVI